ncbi:TonB-dependent receptor [Comamonas sp. lk]|uniref:TonB-dependent siderophore receptor n=1 Tax=Comamonas sp. lk TaxID=2201272 RepID=UPI001F08A777|nr:TonB-dependent receptor [Comamonas sp. lk]
MSSQTPFFSAPPTSSSVGQRPASNALAGLVHLALVAMAGTLPAVAGAQIAVTAQAAQRDYVRQFDVAAGPLGSALLSLASQAGVSLSLDMGKVRERQSAGLKGTMSLEQGFERLLQGSGLKARRVGDGSYALEPASRTEVEASAAATAALGNTVAADAHTMQEVLVSARTQGNLTPPVRQVTTLEREEIETLRQGSDSLATLLSKAVPGMADSSHAITDYGQTLRGRNMLVLVDGIPMNTNRDSSRNLANINPADIEQIEVLRGSSAIYGSGAAGGIVSIRTRRPSGETYAETTVTGVAPLSRLGASGLGAEVQHYMSGGNDVVDYSVSLGAKHVGASFDAKGDRIAPEPSQGDLFDSNIHSLSGKIGFKLDASQRLQLSASHHDAKQSSDYGSDPSVARLPAGSATAKAIKGLQLADQNRVKNSMLGLDYEHKDLAGSTLAAQLYYRDFFARFAPFDARAVSVRGGNVDQTMQNSNVLGGRLTIKTPLGSSQKSLLIWGADFNQERSDMPIDIFDPKVYDASAGMVFNKIGRLTYMPRVTTRSLGAFAQLQHRFSDQWSAEGGVRYDKASASFGDFVPLSQSRVANPATVRGGTVSYGDWTFNAGAVFTPVQGQEIYGSYSQGFELPDIGIQVRNATPSFNLGNSLLQSVKTDTVELGWRGRFDTFLANLSVFQSSSDLGALQSFNNGLTLARTKEKVHGLEAAVDYFSKDDKLRGGGSLTWMRGREQPQGAANYQVLTGYRIPPLKLTAYVEYRPDTSWSHRLQATYYGSRDYRINGVNAFGRREVSSYTTLDLISRWKINAKNSVVLGVENLLNRQYYPLYSQLMRSSSNTSRLPAAGAVLKVGYTHTW